MCCTDDPLSFSAMSTAELAQRASRVVGVGDHAAVDDVDPGVAQQRLGLVLAQPAGVARAGAPVAAASANAAISRSRPGSPAGVRIAAAQRMPVRSPATAGTPDWANRHAAASSSSSGSVEATIVGAGLSRAPAMIPSRTARQDSSTAPVSPAGWS